MIVVGVMFYISDMCFVEQSECQSEVNVTELQRREMRQLKKKLETVVQEKCMLQKNIRDAEAALRTSDRYEWTLAGMIGHQTGMIGH